MKFIDLFAGIGGIRLGLEKQDFECVFSCEKDRYARETYKANFNEEPYEDIQTLNSNKINDIPSFDLLAAGFPCQPFSISGKQDGFKDQTRGTLFFDIVRILEFKRPPFILLENVAHLVNHDKGRTFKVIYETLIGLGYKVSFKVLNSSQYGVAQNRARIFVIGSLYNNKFEFPNSLRDKFSVKDIMENKDHVYLPEEDYTLLESTRISPNGMLFTGYLNKNIRTKGVREDTLHLSRTHRQTSRIYDYNYIHPTLTASEQSGRYYILDHIGVRKLSMLECYRLQGFPDDFKKPVSISQQYKQIGNSVTVPVIEHIARNLQESL